MKHYTNIVSFKLAKQLKECGYPQDIYTESAYDGEGNIIEWIGKSTLAAPSYAELFDWLLESGLCISIHAIKTSDNISWISHLTDIEESAFDGSFGYRNSFEDAVIPAIEKAIQIIEQS